MILQDRDLLCRIEGIQPQFTLRKRTEVSTLEGEGGGRWRVEDGHQ